MLGGRVDLMASFRPLPLRRAESLHARPVAATCANSASSAAPSTLLPVVVLPGYSRPLVRVSDYRELLERCTYDGQRVR